MKIMPGNLYKVRNSGLLWSYSTGRFRMHPGMILLLIEIEGNPYEHPKKYFLYDNNIYYDSLGTQQAPVHFFDLVDCENEI